ncbi:nucleotidyltransferase domain-containing protein [Mycoplasmatota bacterium]|nr:nucleotidyltransferase domain-containing protein [Mycoplasmatota bacterium]
MRKRILNCLNDIEKEENVKIIFAVESGSRAWGFASEDSDYDVRFVYVRPKNEYLKINKNRDVIEYMLNEELDINGWDLDKTCKLMFSSNPTLFEWINSPIVYYSTPFLKDIKDLSKDYFSTRSVVYHYLHMGISNYEKYIRNKEKVVFKKYFYVLRPILAALWILKYNSVPPILFSTLVDDLLKGELKPIINTLLDMKIKTNEKKTINRIELLNVYIEQQIQLIEQEVSLFKNNLVTYDKLNKLLIKGIDYFFE